VQTPSIEAPLVNDDELGARIERSPRLRRPFEAGVDHGPFVVIGPPSAWPDAVRALRDAGERVAAFFDLAWESRRLVVQGRPVLRGRFMGPLSRLPVFFAGEIHKRYFSGVPDSVGRCVYQHPLSTSRQKHRADPMLLAHAGDALREVFGSLADAHSRDTYASIVRGRRDADAGYFRVAPYPEYHHPIVRARRAETVLDVGAFYGDSAWLYAWQTRGLGKIVALEPSPRNYMRLVRMKLPGLMPICLGAWDRDDVLTFKEDGGSSRITSGGTSTIHVCAIDRLVRDLPLDRVDLIKLDVEGAEREALEGARETIARDRPKLQISIYHHAADLYELPLLVRSLVRGDYDYYVGHHGPYHTETDLYAVPR
jgi:FkbM family methyltransferase